MNRKHLLSLSCVSFLAFNLAPMTQAQTPAAPATPAAATATGAKGEGHEGKMKEELGLSDDQTAKLKPIFESQKAELSAVKENNALSKEDQKSQMKAIREKYKPQIAAILTPEQQEKMKAAREAKKNAAASTTPAPAPATK